MDYAELCVDQADWLTSQSCEVGSKRKGKEEEMIRKFNQVYLILHLSTVS